MIFFIMGKTCSGKDSFITALKAFKLKRLVTFTTRPMRKGEKNGREYFFVDTDFFTNHRHLIAENITYKTQNGKWSYFSFKQELDKNTNYIVSGSLKMFKNFKKIYNENVVPVFLDITEQEQLKRALNRENITNKDYEEMKRRLKADNKDYKNVMLEYPIVIDSTKSLSEMVNMFLLTTRQKGYILEKGE